MPSARRRPWWTVLCGAPALALSVLGGAASAPSPAGAQECDEPLRAGPIEGTPSAGAVNVTLDAVVRVHYSAGYFEPGGPGVEPSRNLHVGACLGGCGSPCELAETVPVAGLLQVHGDDLVFVPDAPFEPRTQYVALAAGVDGDLEIPFCTGSRPDLEPPVLGAIDREAPVRVGPQCDLPDGGYRVGIYFEPATDDGPPGSIEYLLYLTRGVDVDEPRLAARARNYPADRITMSILLEPELGTTPVCVQLVAVDGVGNVTVNDEPHCFDPITRTWFYGGCSARGGHGAATNRGALVVFAATLALLAAARRRAR